MKRILLLITLSFCTLLLFACQAEEMTVLDNVSFISISDSDGLSYDVQLKDSDGIVVGNDFIHLENFTPGAKHKVELLYVPEDTETLELSLDYFAIK